MNNYRDDTINDAAADDALDALIAGHDVADTAMTADRAARRDVLLAQILADAPAADPAATAEVDATADAYDTAEVAGTSFAPRGPRRRWMRVARWAVPAAVAAALAGVFAMGNLPGSQGVAYASWTPDPTPLTGQALADAESACRANLAESLTTMQDVPADQRPTVTPEAARTVIAEQRGDFVFLSMVADDTSTAQCFFDAGDLSRVVGSTGGFATAGAPQPEPVPPGQVEAAGAGASSGPQGDYVFTTGRVDPGTRAVTVRTAGQTINASVADGHFAAWWPQRLLGANAPNPPVAYDVTRADGQVVTDAPDLLAPKAPGPEQIGAISTGGGVSADGPVATLGGQAGERVAAVTIHVDGRTIEAPVSDGVFYAEWPSQGSEMKGTPTFDLRLVDGTVLRDQQPVAR